MTHMCTICTTSRHNKDGSCSCLLSNLTRETAFMPLLSSSSLFLAIMADFFVFAWGYGAGAQRGPKHGIFHIFFVARKPEITLKANGTR